MNGFLKHKKNGVTLVELLLVVAGLSVFFIGLFTLINNVSHGILSLGGSLGLNDQASEAMYWIGSDFRNAKASSMGNYLNCLDAPGFELPMDPNTNPNGWGPLTKYAKKLSTGVHPDEITKGFYSIGLIGKTTNYYSNPVSLAAGQKYIFSVWAHIDGSAEARLLDEVNNTILMVSSTCTGVPYWKHLTSTMAAPLAAGAQARIKLATTSDWGRIQVVDDNCVFPSFTLNGKDELYSVYRNAGGVEMAHWDKFTAAWIKESLGSISNWKGMPVAVNKLGYPRLAYSGDGHNLAYSWYDGAIWQYKTDIYHIPWSLVGMAIGGVPEEICLKLDSNDNPHISAIFRYCYNNGFGNIDQWELIYASSAPVVGWSLQSVVTGPCAHSYGTGSNSLALDSGNNPHIAYFEYETGKVKYTKWTGGGWLPPETLNTNLLAANTYNSGVSMALDQNGWPFIAYNSVRAGGRMDLKCTWWDGAAWLTKIIDSCGSVYSGEDHGISVAFDENNKPCVAYSVGGGTQDLSPDFTVRLYGWNGVGWTKTIVATNPNNPGNGDTFIQLLFDKDYFTNVGWWDWTVADAKYRKTCRVLYDDVSISPAEMVFSTATVINTYEYYTTYTTGTPTGNQWRKQRLRYEVVPSTNTAAPGILYRERWVGPNPGDYVPDLHGNGVLCENVKSFNITNQNQENFEVELVLEKKINADQRKEYRLKTSFTPLVP